MLSLTETLTTLCAQAFSDLGLPPALGAVRASDRPDLAQFQCNGAMAAAKSVGKNPRAVAEDVVAKLSASALFSKIEIAGPGFINLNVTDAFLADHARAQAMDARGGLPVLSQGETVVLDYGGPNIAKPMHVGHLRAAIIGDSVRRTMAFAGYKTLGDVHMGDWGTHMGMIISEYLMTGQAARVEAINIDDDAAVDAFMSELSEMYPRVSGACKEDEARKAQALAATVAIQNKDPAHYRLWEVIRAASIRGMKRNYESLDVHFDLWKGEADVNDIIPAMGDKLKAQGFAVEDDGAWIIPVKKNDDKKEVPPLILYKRDGAVMYGSTDLATIVERIDLYNPAKIIYIVDQRQHLHFEQVFRAARLSGIANDGIELTHAGFGTMNGPDGKPFKTRAGGVMKLEDLIEMGLEKARARITEAELAQDMSDDEREDVARKVAIAAIKFADLQNQRQADYIFDLDRLTSFEGKTGPYLLYQAVRVKSLLRKAEYKPSTPDFVIGDADRALILLLTQAPDSLSSALAQYAPHYLCDYAYRLAQEFSRFYAHCHILSEKDEKLRASRLALCAMTVGMLERVLELLGITTPERM